MLGTRHDAGRASCSSSGRGAVRGAGPQGRRGRSTSTSTTAWWPAARWCVVEDRLGVTMTEIIKCGPQLIS
ncbi:MAG: hypothetical protein MZV49_26490 [Rhodopseudomonas palustris]|nr:hypothetical protein [Rhodopseudomonas palustris]